ncbi:hypothetical protein M885DRAFT_600403, partial [Pelagophyceae sp. CCMP2097]
IATREGPLGARAVGARARPRPCKRERRRRRWRGGTRLGLAADGRLGTVRARHGCVRLGRGRAERRPRSCGSEEVMCLCVCRLACCPSRPRGVRRRRAAPCEACDAGPARGVCGRCAAASACFLRQLLRDHCRHLLGAGMPLGRRALEEAQRFLFVLRHAATGYIKHAEALGCFPPALRRGEAVPPRGFFERLRHAITVREQLAEAVLRNRKSLLGCAPVPHRGGLVVDLDARAVLVEYPQCVLGSCVSLRHGEFVQL